MAESLYLGKTFDPATKALGDRFLLDQDDLATHGIVIGMTGSGKTGLSVGMIEELLRAKVPVIVIDPKGDMGNLALAFDQLSPAQFLPWVDADAAAREGQTREQAATAAAEAWSKGLADWGLSQADVAAYAANHTTRVFTPGSTAGSPLNLIDSMRAPEGDFEANEEELRDEIDSIVTALLGFVKITADPVSSREYILLFQLIETAWRNHQDLDLESLIGQVANPPIEKVGALPLDAFYPQKDRNTLMFALNNLVASPPFEVWRTGEPIDIESWVRSADGKPQLSIVYTAHLDDSERIFVTAIILNKLKTWMRRQPGTSDLRCLFYMDEIYGYFPPTENPATKKPLLTLLKQARAYGVGVVLATQNPVDLDYKGLANMGFWAIGRLQTSQDQARVKEGIEAALADAGSAFNFDEMIAGVQKRVFLVHDIHRKAPTLMQTRWAMSYLRGPITRDEIKLLDTAGGPVPRTAPTPAASPVDPQRPVSAPAPSAGAPPLPAGTKARYYNLYAGNIANPYVFAKAAVRYKAGGVASDESVRVLGFAMRADGAVTELVEGTTLEVDESKLADDTPTGLSYADLPAYLTIGRHEGDRAGAQRPPRRPAGVAAHVRPRDKAVRAPRRGCVPVRRTARPSPGRDEEARGAPGEARQAPGGQGRKETGDQRPKDGEVGIARHVDPLEHRSVHRAEAHRHRAGHGAQQEPHGEHRRGPGGDDRDADRARPGRTPRRGGGRPLALRRTHSQAREDRRDTHPGGHRLGLLRLHCAAEERSQVLVRHIRRLLREEVPGIDRTGTQVGKVARKLVRERVPRRDPAIRVAGWIGPARARQVRSEHPQRRIGKGLVAVFGAVVHEIGVPRVLLEPIRMQPHLRHLRLAQRFEAFAMAGGRVRVDHVKRQRVAVVRNGVSVARGVRERRLVVSDVLRARPRRTRPCG